MRQTLFLAGTILLTVCAAMATDGVSGKWTMAQQPHNGGPPRVTTFDLKADGTSLSGTVAAPMGGRSGSTPSTPIAISNGKVNGNTAAFDVVRTFAGNPVTTRYECTASGDTMRVKQTIDLGNGPHTVEVEAKRAAQ